MRIRLLALPVTLGPTVVAGSKAAAGATVVSVLRPTYGGLLGMAPSSRPSARPISSPTLTAFTSRSSKGAE